MSKHIKLLITGILLVILSVQNNMFKELIYSGKWTKIQDY
jgi:hypothetical protein